MRRGALIVAVVLFAAYAAAEVAAAEQPGVAAAFTRTVKVRSLHYAVQVGIHAKKGVPWALRFRGQSDAHSISVHFASGGASGGELLYGPFLYELAPNGKPVHGKVRWLRTTLARLSASSQELMTLRALKIGPLLQLAGRGRLEGDATGHEFRGPVAYDDPVVRDTISHLTGGLEFRKLRLTVHVRGGLIDRLQLTGKTADGLSTLSVAAHLFGFNQALHLVPPKPGTFMDVELQQLSE